jgi:Pvc16 N-terminal domain/Carboxypeptidase regulatory-like domain
MLAGVNASIARLLHERGGLDPDEVEVSFRQPTHQWADSRVLPTVNCFLFAVEEFTDLRNNALQASPAQNGRVTQRLPPRRYNLRYQITAWSSEPADEHLLFWRALATLTRHNPLPEDLLAAEARAAGLPFHTRVGRPDEGPSPTELWSALTLPPRPALIYTVVAPLDLDITLDAPLVLSATLRVRRSSPAQEAAAAPIDPALATLDRETLLVGGVVRDRAGEPVAGAVVALAGSAQDSVTDTLGRYTLRIRRPGPTLVTVSTGAATPQTRTIVADRPSTVFDIDLD